MARVTRRDIDMALEALTVNAKRLGLMTDDESIYYNAGNASYGIAAVLEVRDKDYHHRRASFLPSFTYKDTKADHFRILSAVNNALFCVQTFR